MNKFISHIEIRDDSLFVIGRQGEETNTVLNSLVNTLKTIVQHQKETLQISRPNYKNTSVAIHISDHLGYSSTISIDVKNQIIEGHNFYSSFYVTIWYDKKRYTNHEISSALKNSLPKLKRALNKHRISDKIIF